MRFKSVREPKFSAYLYVAILFYFNIITVFAFLGYFFDFNLYRDYNINYMYISGPLGIFIMVVKYITIYSKREEIIDNYSQNGINKYKVLLYKLYIIASFVLLLVSLSLTKTLFKKDVNLKNQEKVKITIPKLDTKGDPFKTY